MKIDARYKNDGRLLVSLETGAAVPTVSIPVIDAASDGAAVRAGVLSDSGISDVAAGHLAAVKVPYADIEIDNDEYATYNEEYLARLRDVLKSIDDNPILHSDAAVFIMPVGDGIAEAGSARFIDAMVHTARRIKDCACVIGFAIPDDIARDSIALTSLISALRVKHPQYVYFGSVQTSDMRLIQYSLR